MTKQNLCSTPVLLFDSIKPEVVNIIVNALEKRKSAMQRGKISRDEKRLLTALSYVAQNKSIGASRNQIYIAFKKVKDLIDGEKGMTALERKVRYDCIQEKVQKYVFETKPQESLAYSE